MSGWVLPEALLGGATSYAPQPHEMADLQLLLSGALAPIHGFHTRADLEAIRRTGRLADGTPWPVPVTLEVPAALVDGIDTTNPLKRALMLTDPDGAPIAALDAVDVWPSRDGWCGAGGPVRRVSDADHGTFAQLRLTPEQTAAVVPAGRVLGVIADRPLHRPQLAQIAYAARAIAGHVLVLIPVAETDPSGLPPEALVRSIFAARDRLPASTMVTIPLRRRRNEVTNALIRARVAAAFGATHLLAVNDRLSGAGPRALLPRELAYDSRDGQWRSADDIPPRHRRAALTTAEINDLLDRGVPLPEWHTPPAVARELAKARPPRRSRGLVVFFTGLSGSGKSTIARIIAEELAETGERRVTLLDGDTARRYLSTGPGPAVGERDSEVHRIAFVAAETARHGGLALCCPVAPHAAARAAARELARTAGAGFIMVHVSTPAAVCSERQRAGGYLAARTREPGIAGGGEDSFDMPADAELVIDTSNLAPDDAAGQVFDYLVTEGWLDRP